MVNTINFTEVNPILPIYFSPENAPQNFKLPTKEESEKVFFGLGTKFWKQMVDGKFHKYGARVFDDGLHNPDRKEPGFFNSLFDGCKYTADHLKEDLSINFYKSLNKKLCAHFKTSEGNALADSAETGKFRQSDKVNLCCRLHLLDFIDEDTSLKNAKEQWDECKEKCNKINREIMTFSSKFQVPTVAWISAWPDTGIRIEYRCISSQDHERIVQCLFDDYKKKICELNSKLNSATLESEINSLMSLKVEVIADLFQKLEWLHPFPDGQGRTDLVLLAKLLSEEGLNPAILEDPYVSTFTLLDEWKEYLIQGMEQWRKERDNCSSL